MSTPLFKVKKGKDVWWRGERGEWYVVIQFFLILLVIFGPRSFNSMPCWFSSPGRSASYAGAALLLSGFILALAGTINLGRNLTPLPSPKRDAILVQSGAYRLVRHPIYSGILLMAFGWSFAIHSIPTLFYAALLFGFFDLKSRREEIWLVQKFPEYTDYQRRVRKLIPLVY
jgi:protein-S-isoprenylcysteine O-methyltransferase Ste14